MGKHCRMWIFYISERSERKELRKQHHSSQFCEIRNARDGAVAALDHSHIHRKNNEDPTLRDCGEDI